MEALRERQLHAIAQKYSQSPEQVRKWSDYDYHRAVLNVIVEGEQKFTPEDVKEVKKPMAAKPGFVLDLDYSFWQKFISDGVLDEAKLIEGGYNGEGQVEWIAGEMQSLGWLGGDDDKRDTAPLEPPAED